MLADTRCVNDIHIFYIGFVSGFGAGTAQTCIVLRVCPYRQSTTIVTTRPGHLLLGPHFVHTSSVTQPPVSFLPLKGLFQNTCEGGGQSAFQPSTTSWKLCSRHQRSGVHRDWSTGTLTQLPSFLFTPTYSL